MDRMTMSVIITDILLAGTLSGFYSEEP
jgi:hypothetical protein